MVPRKKIKYFYTIESMGSGANSSDSEDTFEPTLDEMPETLATQVYEKIYQKSKNWAVS